jgi:DNA (cytosine-5)-methyltransferase 1
MPNKIIDLFSGCGGFSLGAELAGFRTEIAIDIDGDLQSSFHRNFPHAKPILADIKLIDGAFWAEKLGGTRPAGIIGGPPCQGFSRIGKRDPADPRNTLIGHFFRQVNLLRPKFFIMENVEGLLDDVGSAALSDAITLVSGSYCVLPPIVVNAATYGAPTERKRVVVIGFDPEDVNPLTEETFAPTAGIRRVTVLDAISDLPSPTAKSTSHEGYCWRSYPKRSAALLDYASACRAAPPEELGWQPAIEMLESQLVTGIMPTVHSDEVRARFSKVAQGTVDTVSRFPRLHWERRSPTLRAGTGRDRGSHQSMRPIHPSEPRVITVREGARLQGFPDWFVFHPTIWHSFRMIGNSVSPIISRALLTAISPHVIRRPATPPATQ